MQQRSGTFTALLSERLDDEFKVPGGPQQARLWSLPSDLVTPCLSSAPREHSNYQRRASSR